MYLHVKFTQGEPSVSTHQANLPIWTIQLMYLILGVIVMLLKLSSLWLCNDTF